MCGGSWESAEAVVPHDTAYNRGHVPAPADFLIENADLIATCAGPAPRRGAAQREISPLQHGVIAAHEGTIVYVGAAEDLARQVELQRGATRIDARGCTVLPGFVDAHTHLVYAGDRRHELQQRLAGATYAEIAAAGGGIAYTVKATRAASADDLVQSARSRLDEMLASGTTTCEAKSGYGLTTESELRLLHVINRLNAEHAVDLVPTFLGAHEVPVEYQSRPDDYVALVIEKMIPVVADEALAEWCDVFCEEGAFTLQESVAILTAAKNAGLKPRIHAEEFATSGGTYVAAKVGARSADHLIYVDEAGADALAAANVCATLLPIAAFYLKLGRFAPARLLIDRGAPVALASDVNPGGGLSPSMPFAITLACFGMNMTLEEALIAATLNAAWSIDRAETVGSLEPGKLMDAVMIKGALPDLIRVGTTAVRMVIKRGKAVFWAQ
jgi:imidazolonepropionase